MSRIAVIDREKCNPKRCNFECKSSCPSNGQGKECITGNATTGVKISEELCNDKCNICTKKCPFDAIKVINIDLSSISDKNNHQLVHRYGSNGFVLYRMPYVIGQGNILGILGSNGTGKSTAVNILSGKLIPNFGEEKQSKTIIQQFKGKHELQNYFKQLPQQTISFKPQDIDMWKNSVTQQNNIVNVKDIITNQSVINDLKLDNLLDKKIDTLSGGELQKVAIAFCASSNSLIKIHDEFTNYLDVKQRAIAAEAIKQHKGNQRTFLIDHDLFALDLVSDYISLIYGKSGAYGVCSSPCSTNNGINNFLDGFSPQENFRFRDKPLSFQKNVDLTSEKTAKSQYIYPSVEKNYENFHLTIDSGSFSSSEIIVMLGENGMGKSTMIKVLAGLEKHDSKESFPSFSVSYKPQIISAKFKGTVLKLFQEKILKMFTNSQFKCDVLQPLGIGELEDRLLTSLSGGELARVALALALGKPSDIYLLDEPSAFLDVEQRLAAAKAIKKFIMNNGKTAFIIEHDLLMATYLADKIIVFEGEPGKKCTASSPLPVQEGLNKFLKNIGITFRKDPETGRPRPNSLNSTKDKEQKKNGNYYDI